MGDKTNINFKYSELVWALCIAAFTLSLSISLSLFRLRCRIRFSCMFYWLHSLPQISIDIPIIVILFSRALWQLWNGWAQFEYKQKCSLKLECNCAGKKFIAIIIVIFIRCLTINKWNKLFNRNMGRAPHIAFIQTQDAKKECHRLCGMSKLYSWFNFFLQWI